jgi:hypothetical protein
MLTAKRPTKGDTEYSKLTLSASLDITTVDLTFAPAWFGVWILNLILRWNIDKNITTQQHVIGVNSVGF